MERVIIGFLAGFLPFGFGVFVVGFFMGKSKAQQVYIDDPAKVELEKKLQEAWRMIKPLETELDGTKRTLEELKQYNRNSDNNEITMLREVLDIQTRKIADIEASAEEAHAAAERYLNEVLDLREWIEKNMGTPGYAVMVQRRDRAEVVKRLAAAGWSMRKIEGHLWGYYGGMAHIHVNRILGSRSTSIVKVGAT
ncbi:MAG: hypothetical protein JXA21_17120 [Anaerolineae bacterium]|nr:hypothetical protein [Anaerolineae bacterium]